MHSRPIRVVDHGSVEPFSVNSGDRQQMKYSLIQQHETPVHERFFASEQRKKVEREIKKNPEKYFNPKDLYRQPQHTFKGTHYEWIQYLKSHNQEYDNRALELYNLRKQA